MLRLRGLADADRELAGLAGGFPAQAQRISEIAVTTLVERARQADAGLHRDNHAAPRDLFFGPIIFFRHDGPCVASVHRSDE
jgi:hypothetical protein